MNEISKFCYGKSHHERNLRHHLQWKKAQFAKQNLDISFVMRLITFGRNLRNATKRSLVEFVLTALVTQWRKPLNQFGDRLRSAINGGLLHNFLK